MNAASQLEVVADVLDRVNELIYRNASTTWRDKYDLCLYGKDCLSDRLASVGVYLNFHTENASDEEEVRAFATALEAMQETLQREVRGEPPVQATAKIALTERGFEIRTSDGRTLTLDIEWDGNGYASREPFSLGSIGRGPIKGPRALPLLKAFLENDEGLMQFHLSESA